jgi:hypothetical protein
MGSVDLWGYTLREIKIRDAKFIVLLYEMYKICQAVCTAGKLDFHSCQFDKLHTFLYKYHAGLTGQISST